MGKIRRPKSRKPKPRRTNARKSKVRRTNARRSKGSGKHRTFRKNCMKKCRRTCKQRGGADGWSIKDIKEYVKEIIFPIYRELWKANINEYDYDAWNEVSSELRNINSKAHFQMWWNVATVTMKETESDVAMYNDLRTRIQEALPSFGNNEVDRDKWENLLYILPYNVMTKTELNRMLSESKMEKDKKMANSNEHPQKGKVSEPEGVPKGANTPNPNSTSDSAAAQNTPKGVKTPKHKKAGKVEHFIGTPEMATLWVDNPILATKQLDYAQKAVKAVKGGSMGNLPDNIPEDVFLGQIFWFTLIMNIDQYYNSNNNKIKTFDDWLNNWVNKRSPLKDDTGELEADDAAPNTGADDAAPNTGADDAAPNTGKVRVAGDTDNYNWTNNVIKASEGENEAFYPRLLLLKVTDDTERRYCLNVATDYINEQLVNKHVMTLWLNKVWKYLGLIKQPTQDEWAKMIKARDRELEEAEARASAKALKSEMVRPS